MHYSFKTLIAQIFCKDFATAYRVQLLMLFAVKQQIPLDFYFKAFFILLCSRAKGREKVFCLGFTPVCYFIYLSNSTSFPTNNLSCLKLILLSGKKNKKSLCCLYNGLYSTKNFISNISIICYKMLIL